MRGSYNIAAAQPQWCNVRALSARRRLVPVTFFRSAAAGTLSTAKLPLDELRDLIQCTDADSKEQLPWLKLARFGNKRTDKNSLRHNANVLAIDGVEADYDAERITFAMKTSRSLSLQCTLRDCHCISI